MATLPESRQTVNTGYICASWTDSGAVTVAIAFHITIVSKCPDSYFLMEIIFVRWDEARRGGVETGPLRFISRPQSIFCLASWCAARTCRLQGHPWVPPPTPHPQTTSTAGQQPSAVQMTCSLPLQWDASARLGMNSAASLNFLLYVFGSVCYQEESCDRVALWENWYNCNINTVLNTALSPKNQKTC